MKPNDSHSEPLTFWQLVFSQSKVNGAQYKDDHLPELKWNWPTDTYLQRRRRETNGYHIPELTRFN
jgi:hypothetical protein